MVNHPVIAMPTYMRTTQLANIISVSPSWLRSMRCEGKGPKYIKRGDSKNSPVIYLAADVIEWMKTWNIHEPTAQQNAEAANGL